MVVTSSEKNEIVGNLFVTDSDLFVTSENKDKRT